MLDITASLSNPTKIYPFKLSETLDKSLLRYPNSNFCGDTDIEGSYYSLDNDIFVDAEINFCIDCFCDLCGRSINEHFSLQSKIVFFKKPIDIDDYTYSQNKIDLIGAVCDEIVSGMPNQILHDQNCKGLCPICFCDKNVKKCNCEKDIGKDNPFIALKDINL